MHSSAGVMEVLCNFYAGAMQVLCKSYNNINAMQLLCEYYTSAMQNLCEWNSLSESIKCKIDFPFPVNQAGTFPI